MAEDALVGIIGAGPAGIAAGVQLKRFHISPIIFERDKIGGLVRNAHLIENSMFFPDGIPGAKFADILIDYAWRYSLQIKNEEVRRVEKKENFRVFTYKGDYDFKYLIIATGTVPRRLPFEGIKYHVVEMLGSYNSVLIIGGGDIALDYALSMKERADEVIVLYRSKIRALPTLIDCAKTRGIAMKKGELRGVRRENNKKVAMTTAGEFVVDEIMAAIGRVPDLDMVKGIDDERMFIIGDAKNAPYRQTTMAIGDGIKAAMDIWRCENEDSCRDRR